MSRSKSERFTSGILKDEFWESKEMGLFLSLAKALLKSDVSEHILFEDDIDEHTFSCKDMSLVSLLHIKGLQSIPGNPEVKRAEETMLNILKYAVANSGGHSLSFYYNQDPNGTERSLQNALLPSRRALAAMDLPLDDILDENIQVLSKGNFVVHEECYIAVWSHTSALFSSELKTAINEAIAKRKKAGVLLTNTRDPFMEIPALTNRHVSMTDQIINDLVTVAKLDVSKISRHEVIRASRRWLDPDTALDWYPTLHGDAIPSRERFPDMPPKDISFLLGPRLDWQVLHQDVMPVEGEPSICQVGNHFFTSILVELFPSDLQRFHSLQSRLPKYLPWRVTQHITHGMDPLFTYRSLLVNLFTALSPENKAIRSDIKALGIDNFPDSDGAEGGEVIPHVGMTMHLTTWADSVKKCKQYRTALTQTIEGWGSPSVRDDSIAPAESLISSGPACNYSSLAPKSFPRAQDAVLMLPLSRPSSPWETGALVLSTTDGKVFFYQPGSSLQTAHIELIFARSGGGKSVLSNALDTSLLMRAGNNEFPDISTVDIGASAKGWADMLRNKLPESQKHLVYSCRLRMDEEYAFNFLDTELGMRQPLPHQRNAIIDFLTQLVTAPGEPLHDDFSRLIPMAIEKTYDTYADIGDKQQPKHYNKNIVPEVDVLIKKHAEKNPDFRLDDTTRWWDVVDALFKDGYANEAILAQRHAVPTLLDMVSIVQSNDTINASYGKKSGVRYKLTSEESVAEAFSRVLGAALREFRFIGLPTKLDVSRAKIKVIDLEEVCDQGTPSAERQTGLMYTLAIHAMTSHYSLHKDDIKKFPSLYQDYHEKRIREIRNTPKRIVCDELHRAPPRITKSLERLSVEGRKKGFQICLISQMLSHFSKGLIEASSTRFILGQPSPNEIQDIKASFQLEETDIAALQSNLVHGPNKNGTAFFMSFTTRTGTYSQVVRMKKGPIELWSYSTTPGDNDVANTVAQALGSEKYIHALAHAYPSGSCMDDYDQQVRRMSANNKDFVTSKVNNNILDKIAKDVVSRWLEHERIGSV